MVPLRTWGEDQRREENHHYQQQQQLKTMRSGRGGVMVSEVLVHGHFARLILACGESEDQNRTVG